MHDKSILIYVFSVEDMGKRRRNGHKGNIPKIHLIQNLERRLFVTGMAEIIILGVHKGLPCTEILTFHSWRATN